MDGGAHLPGQEVFQGDAADAGAEQFCGQAGRALGDPRPHFRRCGKRIALDVVYDQLVAVERVAALDVLVGGVATAVYSSCKSVALDEACKEPRNRIKIS